MVAFGMLAPLRRHCSPSGELPVTLAVNVVFEPSNTARAVGLGNELGAVAVGKLADLVLLEADPLADITNTTRIAAVVANGRLFEKSELQRLLMAAQQTDATPAASPTP